MKKEQLINTALILGIITIVYNVAEGLASVFFGLDDETLVLLGFGLDSFVEVLSGIGILHMITRMKKLDISDVVSMDKFERQALRLTGTAFYILTIGLIICSILNIINRSKPSTTLAGIIISLISILSMLILMKWKLITGKKLCSKAIIADANCTRTCFYLSFILLLSSALYELFNIAWFDVAGSIGIAFFAFSEGKESFEKAKRKSFPLRQVVKEKLLH